MQQDQLLIKVEYLKKLARLMCLNIVGQIKKVIALQKD